MTKDTVKTAVIGTGYLGRFHAHKYAALPNAELIAIADPTEGQGQAVAEEAHTRWVANYQDILGEVDAVSIAAPTTLHHRIAKECLEAGVHVLVEKPITVTTEEADELIEIAKTNGCILQVGHLERFNAAVLDAMPLLKAPRFIEAHRLAPFKPRATDVNVVLDLMIHDIDIVLNMVDSDVVDIVASGSSILSDSTDICNARLTFANGCVANVTASRISMKSERKMRIFQEKSCITVDFQNRMLSHYFTGEGEMFPGVPNIESSEKFYENGDALYTEIDSFIQCIQDNKAPLVSGHDGRQALDVATTITQLVTG
ncbi:oxidoreductase domain protein [gamma proteobacterium HTCC5015]|nr:oxidoreductase domain protein [gamma proteobacterium HTCC5015]